MRRYCFIRSLMVIFLVTFYLGDTLYGQGRLPKAKSVIKSGQKTWGDKIGFFGSVEAKSRGEHAGKATEDVTYQCVELAKNVFETYYDGKVEKEVRYTTWGSAQEFWNGERFDGIKIKYETLDKHKLGEKKAGKIPRVGDMIFFQKGKYGHVAVVGNSVINKDGSGFVEIIQQNVGPNTAYDIVEIKNNKVIDSYGSMKVLGWLSPKADYSPAKPLPKYVGVNKIYQDVLGRSADVDGIKHYIRRLKVGDTPDDIIQNMYSSTEFKVGLAAIEKLKMEESKKPGGKAVAWANVNMAKNSLIAIVQSGSSHIGSASFGYKLPKMNVKTTTPAIFGANYKETTGHSSVPPGAFLAPQNFAQSDWILTQGVSSTPFSASSSYGPIQPYTGNTIYSINNAGVVTASMEKTFLVPTNVSTANVASIFKFVTTEYPNWVGSIYNDTGKVTITTPGGKTLTTTLFSESVNVSDFTPVTGLPAPLAGWNPNDGGGQTIWKQNLENTKHISVAPGGSLKVKAEVTNVADTLYPSAILVGDVSVK